MKLLDSKVTLTCFSSVVLREMKGRVGLATPILTGAKRQSAVSTSSSIATPISIRNTVLHFLRGSDDILKENLN